MKTNNFFLKTALSCCLFMLFTLSSTAQCINTSLWPSSSVSAINDGDPHAISGCNYLGEYSNFTNATIGNDYEFTLEGGGYITVTDTSNNVLAHGVAPFVWTATANSVRLHWNGDAGCSSDTSCHDTGYTNISFVAPPAPENDLCADAIGLECGSVKAGTNIDATNTGEPGFCGTSVSGAGVWYKFEGNGSDVIVTTCSPNTDFDTKLTVYEGACGALVCVGGDDDDSSCAVGLQSLVEFSSEVGTIYYMYVSGFIGAEGNFDLTLTCKVEVDIAESCATVYDGYDPLACTDITATSTFGTPPYTYSWSNGDSGATINVCPTETTTYMVTVTDAAGDTDTAETTVVATNVSCGNKGDKVEVCHVSGNGSSQTICVSPNAVQAHLNHGDSLGACEDTFTCDTAPSCASVISPEAGSIDQSAGSEVTWSAAGGLVEGYTVSIGTTSGGTDVADNVDAGDNLSYDPGTLDYSTTYYVTVTAYNANGSAEGCTESSFTTEESPWCSADALECGSVKSGSTVGLDIGVGIETCDTSLNDAPGQWYSFVGTGDEYSITTCSPNTDFDTKLGVFTGNCNAITCVAGDDDDFSCSNSTLSSLVEFASIEGETYYVFVTGFYSSFSGAAQGNYELSITCIVPPVPPCENADTISCGTSTTVSTVGVEGIDFDSTCSMSDYGKWFKFEGDGNTYNIAATTAGYDIEMAISSGVCGESLTNIACVDSAFSSGTESYSLASVAGTVYYVYVAHWSATSTTTGEFTLTVDCEAPFDGTVVCGETVNTTYCYQSGETTAFTYQSTDGSALSVLFNSGNVENNYDELIVLDSDGVTELYNGYGASGNVSGLSFTSTGDAITVTVSSDTSVSCETSSSINPLDFSVSCAAQARPSVDMNTNDSLTWTMYPNPTKGNVQIDLSPLKVSSAQVDLYDYTGKVIRSLSVNTKYSSKVDMNLQGLSAGVYFVKVISDNGTSVKQLIFN